MNKKITTFRRYLETIYNLDSIEVFVNGAELSKLRYSKHSYYLYKDSFGIFNKDGKFIILDFHKCGILNSETGELVLKW